MSIVASHSPLNISEIDR